jgi:hypothetical protein
MDLRERRCEGVDCIYLVQDRVQCKHDNNPSGSINSRIFLDQLSDCHILKKDSAPQGQAGWLAGWPITGVLK